jgi:hypothetical protein
MGGVLLGVSYGLAFTHLVAPHDGRGADNSNLHVVVRQGEIFRSSAGGVRNKSCLVFAAFI